MKFGTANGDQIILAGLGLSGVSTHKYYVPGNSSVADKPGHQDTWNYLNSETVHIEAITTPFLFNCYPRYV